MTFALWTILVAALLPLFATGAAKSGASGYDNAAPRAWEARLTGWRQRASWAHRNHQEAFPAYAAAVLVAHVAHAPQPVSDALAAIFVVARLGYTWAYVADRATVRSVFWGVGFAATLGLFCAGLLARPA